MNKDMTPRAPQSGRLRPSPAGYADRMPNPEQLGHAGLVGWRKQLADRVAPAAAKRGPVSEDQIRAVIGAAFFLLSVYYVGSTLARIAKASKSR